MNQRGIMSSSPMTHRETKRCGGSIQAILHGSQRLTIIRSRSRGLCAQAVVNTSHELNVCRQQPYCVAQHNMWPIKTKRTAAAWYVITSKLGYRWEKYKLEYSTHKMEGNRVVLFLGCDIRSFQQRFKTHLLARLSVWIQTSITWILGFRPETKCWAECLGLIWRNVWNWTAASTRSNVSGLEMWTCRQAGGFWNGMQLQT